MVVGMLEYDGPVEFCGEVLGWMREQEVRKHLGGVGRRCGKTFVPESVEAAQEYVERVAASAPLPEFSGRRWLATYQMRMCEEFGLMAREAAVSWGLDTWWLVGQAWVAWYERAGEQLSLSEQCALTPPGPLGRCLDSPYGFAPFLSSVRDISEGVVEAEMEAVLGGYEFGGWEVGE